MIEETEALSAIDVNTGSFIGEFIDHSTFLKVNLEAAKAAAKQIKLRNLTGIIIIDFIDMEEKSNRTIIDKYFKRSLALDKSKIKIGNIKMLNSAEMIKRIGTNRRRIENSEGEGKNYCLRYKIIILPQRT